MEPSDYDRPNTIHGLLAKREQLRTLLKNLRAEERKVVCDLDHLDASIRLFDPDADAGRLIRYPTKHRAKKGEVVRLVVRLLKDADRPISTIEITHEQMKARKLKADDATTLLLRRRVGACLNKLKRDGYVRVVDLPGLYHGWEWVR